MLREERKLYMRRCELFFDRLLNDRFDARVPLKAEYAVTHEPVPYAERLTLDYRPIREGEDWGVAWESAWFHITGEVPAAWHGAEVVVQINLSGETLIFDVHGVPVYAVTGNSVFNTSFYKDLFQPPPEMSDHGRIDFWVEAAANSLFGIELKSDPHRLDCDLTGKFPGRVQKLRLGKFNREAWALRFDFEILLELYRTLPPDGYRARQLLRVMNEAINAYADDPANAATARAVLAPELQRHAADSALTATAVGHAHIDVGWLWPVRESIRKAARTFSSQLEMIRRYPGYVFGASQPQLYAFVRDHYPELYQKIRQAVAEGHWELQGGMWVEADCNITSGEAMVRQFVHGKNFFMDEFGVEVRNLWLPDVFGYSAALPQIIRKAGCDYFLTQKLSWSQFNAFPYQTFRWRGIDGSEVLTHFPPENNYNAWVTPSELVPAQDRFAEADRCPEFLSLFGLGDGGGGPSENHLERAMRLHDLEGCPKVRFGKAANFFDRIAPLADRLPEWEGELYLEMHRGTLTTQARTKRNNRRLEQLLVTAEFVAAALPPEAYPHAALDAAWKKLLINQFHDIIPGSSIRSVYEVTEREHVEAIACCNRLIEQAVEQLSTPDEDAILAINTLSDRWHGVIEAPASWIGSSVRDEAGNVLSTQVKDGRLQVLATLPGSSFRTLRRGAAAAATTVVHDAQPVLENELIRYEFNASGELISAYDKEWKRELIPAGMAGNRFLLYVDRPNQYDAWDVDVFYPEEKQQSPSAAAVSEATRGPVESGLTVNLTIGESTLTQHVSLRAGSRRLDFATRADWRETHKLLRVEFPAAVDASEGNYEIQYGFLRRPLHENTSWDKARFEVPAQRYIDLSEHDYGAALLNDCKYGTRVRRQCLSLSLLRAPRYPDPEADRGEQIFTFSFLPHPGTLVESDVPAEAAMLNRAPVIVPGRCSIVRAPFAVESGAVALEVVKRAEKGDALVLRLVERAGRKSDTVLHTTLGDTLKLVETNLLEWTRGEAFQFRDGRLPLTLQPFEIKTLMTAE